MDKYKNPIIEINSIVYCFSPTHNENGILLIKRGDGNKLSLPYKVLQYNQDPQEESKRIAEEYCSDLESQTTFLTVRGDPKRDDTENIVAFVYTIKKSSVLIKESQTNNGARFYSYSDIANMNKEDFYSDHLDILNEFIKIQSK